MKATVLISGIGGQDGSLLADLLLAEGHRVCGVVRRHSVAEAQSERFQHVVDAIETTYGDMTDPESLTRAVRLFKPDYVVNLAAMSQVRISFDIPQYTVQVNAVGLLNILEAVRQYSPAARFYQASSSEMFGNSQDADGYQRETTPMHPASPYGCAKLFAYSMVCHYRRAYGIFAANGILFNHEGPRRGSNFVTAKVVKTAVQIRQGDADRLELGHIDSQRDWGSARDYVRAIWAILQAPEPDDWVVATGETRSVRDLCRYVFQRLGLDYEDYLRQDQKYRRPEELTYLLGDASKIRDQLGWQVEQKWEDMIDDMIRHWSEKLYGTDLLENTPR